MRKIGWIAGILAALLFLLPGCVPGGEAGPLKLVDQAGREVELPGPAERIVSLAPSNTEILFALGLGDKAVGVTEFCDYPPEVVELKKEGKIEVVGGYANPDIEKIVRLGPDLVLATPSHKEIVEDLGARGIPSLILKPKNLEEVLEAIRLVAKAAGAEGAGAALCRKLSRRIAAVTSKTKGLSPEERPGVLYVIWHEPLYTAGEGTPENDVIEKAGGRNIARDIKEYGTIDLETVVARNPEVIICCTGHGEARDLPYLWARTEERLSVTAARKENRIYEIDADLICRPGPRMVDALEQFAHFIHPDLFPSPKKAEAPAAVS